MLVVAVAVFGLLVGGLLQVVHALSAGAPSLACMSMRPLHGLNRAKPASASQFFVTQSSLSYNQSPQSNITVEIATHSSERFFRGFLVQAYDPTSGAQIGSFLSNSDSRAIDSCSSATHRNSQNKRKVSLIWLPAPSADSLSSSSAAAATSGATDWLSGLTTSFNGNNNGSASKRKRQLSRQVRFRATIVVTYQEFYTGFESSELSFEKFDYSRETMGIGAPASSSGATDATVAAAAS